MIWAFHSPAITGWVNRTLHSFTFLWRLAMVHDTSRGHILLANGRVFEFYTACYTVEDKINSTDFIDESQIGLVRQ
jgi:hypothetical protein